MAVENTGRARADEMDDRAFTASLTIMDDDLFMTEFYKDNPGCVATLLRPVLGIEDLEVTSVDVQHPLNSPTRRGRSARLDIRARDSNGRLYDVEIQKDLAKAKPRRARFYAAMADSRELRTGQDYELLPELYIVFATDGDALGSGHRLLRFRHFDPEADFLLNDGVHVVYFNVRACAALDAGTPLGDVAHDLLCADPAQMLAPGYARRALELKSDPREVITMNEYKQRLLEEKEREVTERVTREVTERVTSEVTEKSIRALVANLGWSAEQARAYLTLPDDAGAPLTSLGR